MNRLDRFQIFLLGACKPARKAFKKKFGWGANISDIIAWLQGSELERSTADNWYAWILGQSYEITKSFLNAGANINVFDAGALNYALDGENWYLVKFLVEEGIDVKLFEENWEQDNLLVAAVIYEDSEFLEELIQTGRYSLSDLHDAWREASIDSAEEDILEFYMSKRVFARIFNFAKEPEQ